MSAPADVELRTADGVWLAGSLWAPPAGSRSAVVLVHGFSATRHDPPVTRIAESMARGGRLVLAYDSRGHGISGGSCTLGIHERFDVDAAVAYASQHADHVYVVGASMGGIATVEHLASGERARGAAAHGAVLVATPAQWQVPRSARGVASVLVTQTAVGRAFTQRRSGTRLSAARPRGDPPTRQIRLTSRPVAIVHGTSDRFLPVAAALALYDSLNGPRRLDIVPGMGHGFCTEAIDPITAAVAWLDDTLEAAVS